MKTLREIALLLEETSEPISLKDLGEQAGFFDISLRDLGEYLTDIPIPENVVERVCPNRLALHAGNLRIPYCANKSPERRDTSVRRAVLVIHGNGRNGPGYFRSMLDAAKKAGKSPETIIIAPHFLTEDDVNTHNPGSDVPFWTTDSWKGETTRCPPQRTLEPPISVLSRSSMSLWRDSLTRSLLFLRPRSNRSVHCIAITNTALRD